MFGSVTSLTGEAKGKLFEGNTLLDKGEEAIEEGNDNIRTKEILENIETYEINTSILYDAISSIEADVASLQSDINTSMAIKRQEDKEDEMTYEDDD